MKVHRVQSEAGVPVVRASGPVSTVRPSAASGDDGPRGRVRESSSVITPAYSPIIWDLRVLQTFVFYTNSYFYRMVDAGEIQLSRAAALM